MSQASPFMHHTLDRLVELLRLDYTAREPKDPLGLIDRRVWRFFVNCLFEFAGPATFLMLAAAIAGAAAWALQPYFLERVITRFDDQAGSVLSWSILLLLSFILPSGFALVHAFLAAYKVPLLNAGMRECLFGYSLYHSELFFDRHAPAKVTQRIQNAGRHAQVLFAIAVTVAVPALVHFAVSILLLWRFPAKYGLFLLFWSVAYLLATVLTAQLGRRLTESLEGESSGVAAEAADLFTNLPLISQFALWMSERRRLARFLARESSESRKIRGIDAISVVMETLFLVALVTVICLLALGDHRRGALSSGEFVMLFTLAAGMAYRAKDIGGNLVDAYEAVGGIESALKLVLNGSTLLPLPTLIASEKLGCGISIEHLSFRYPNGTEALCDLSLSVRPGEKLGIVGLSGGGKSTLLKLLSGRLDKTSGTIRIGDRMIETIPPAALARHVLLLDQRPRAFRRSVYENIALAARFGERSEVERAALLAACGHLLDRDDRFAPGEAGLSGGELQRIALARAFLWPSAILLLDEPTTALDARTERVVRRSLEKAMAGRTVIMVAHRLSTLRKMDRIVVIEKGGLIQEGSHERLLIEGGRYAELWSMQAAGYLAA